MSRLKLILVLLVVAFLAAEPLVHTHPLAPRSHSGERAPGNGCPACAAEVQRIGSPAPVVIAPAVVLYRLAVSGRALIACDAALALASRAPPAAR